MMKEVKQSNSIEMVRKKEFYGIAAVALICFLLIALSQKNPSHLHSRPVSFQAIEIMDNDDADSSLIDADDTLSHISIKEIINHQRNRLKRDLYGYKLPGNLNLSDLTLDTGGQPIRTVIITTWRSGSTFLGDIINALPGNYYHYEPLLDYGIVQIRGPPYADSALAVLKSLLNCDYTDLTRYLEFGMSHIYLFTHNKRLWSQCDAYPDYCWDPDFLNEFCKLFPFQSMKTVRMRLKLAEELLQDNTLNVKVILLVRDPRGTLQSRRHRDWCPGVPDCDQPQHLCSDMVADYSAAIRLNKLYPSRFRALRYEDLSLDPYQTTEDIFAFMGLNVPLQVKDFLASHTTINVGGVSSTYRDSKNAPFHWKNDLNATEIQWIEDNCREALKLWGYRRTDGASDLKDFYPLTRYDIN
ncbi:carbohydrate sulfotransferase 5 isoform X2 [Anthonomus grandis grandis]|uniref:carbohydrate sulfotransferase 5 isoform X2 n=1 Tax=Anthonomus grandis grandis TaxID=2921223 RepID=UPI002164F82C|nr:carbohydrate sulfotransferase 5 isoform X2 [Anthonomus grandis grandis]